MPTIKPSAYLRNNYNDVSEFCHSRTEPMFITKNGYGDLAVMSIDAFEQLKGKLELYSLLEVGRSAVKAGEKRSLTSAMKDIKQDIADGHL